MVIESIINPIKAEKKPWEMFFLGFFYTSIAILFSSWIFSEHSSLVMVFLIVMACLPLFYATAKMEEKKDLNLDSEVSMLKEHSKAFSFFILLFLGITLACAIWYVFLPAETSANAFSVQQATINQINGRVTGFVLTDGLFFKIFLNNIKVLVFCILFAFLYGVGAIFILTWNASVIGVAVGNFVRTKMADIASTLGAFGAASYFHVFSLGMIRYFLHGGFEILAYFIGGLAGSIISVAIIRHDFATKKFEKVIFDSANLLMIAFVLLFIGAIVEVYVTPLFF